MFLNILQVVRMKQILNTDIGGVLGIRTTEDEGWKPQLIPMSRGVPSGENCWEMLKPFQKNKGITNLFLFSRIEICLISRHCFSSSSVC